MRAAQWMALAVLAVLAAVAAASQEDLVDNGYDPYRGGDVVFYATRGDEHMQVLTGADVAVAGLDAAGVASLVGLGLGLHPLDGAEELPLQPRSLLADDRSAWLVLADADIAALLPEGAVRHRAAAAAGYVPRSLEVDVASVVAGALPRAHGVLGQGQRSRIPTLAEHLLLERPGAAVAVTAPDAALLELVAPSAKALRVSEAEGYHSAHGVSGHVATLPSTSQRTSCYAAVGLAEPAEGMVTVAGTDIAEDKMAPLACSLAAMRALGRVDGLSLTINVLRVADALAAAGPARPAVEKLIRDSLAEVAQAPAVADADMTVVQVAASRSLPAGLAAALKGSIDVRGSQGWMVDGEADCRQLTAVAAGYGYSAACRDRKEAGDPMGDADMDQHIADVQVQLWFTVGLVLTLCAAILPMFYIGDTKGNMFAVEFDDRKIMLNAMRRND